MRIHEIEAWALRAIERVENSQPTEDSRVELKLDWPDPEKGARRIAGHANAARGEPILWIIGVDENNGVIGASHNELSTWWRQVQSQFDGPVPRLRDVAVYRNAQTAVALCFESEQIPYVVINPSYGKPNGGAVRLEVPWREATAVRSATHSDLIQLLSPLQCPALEIEVGDGRGFVNEHPIPVPPPPHAFRIESPPQSSAAQYIRVKVTNRGRRTARDCMTYLAAVEVESGGRFIDTNYADFMRLVWSHYPGSPSLDILPEVPHWVDVLSTREHEDRFFIETEPKSIRYADGFDNSSVYRLTVMVYAEDAKPARAVLHVDWQGQWNRFRIFGDDGKIP